MRARNQVIVAAGVLFVGCVMLSGQQVAPYFPIGDLPVGTNGVFRHEAKPPQTPSPLAPSVLPQSPAPSANFLALTDDNTAYPPDTYGAVGTNHLMVMLNTSVRVQSRTGTNLSATSLTAFWSGVGGLNNVTDPRVAYDPYNDRWIATACMNFQQANSALLMGVSLTGDPTGAWNKRKVYVDTNNVLWADYPTMGFNKDWVAVQVNMSTIASNTFVRAHIYVFNKTNLYAGNFQTPTRISVTNFAYFNVMAPAATYDRSSSSLYLVQYVNRYTNNVNGSTNYQGVLRLYSISGSIGSEVLNNLDTPLYVTTDAIWDRPAFVPQYTNTYISGGDDRIQNVIYRNGYIWCAHSIGRPNTGIFPQTAVQWWQLATNGVVIQRWRIEDTTGTNFYAYPSIAVNKYGDALIGYSSFSSNQHASANYSFRAFSDPPGSFEGDRIFKAGTDVYWKQSPTFNNRWGDYSATWVDPVNDADFWTIQEFATNHVGALVNGSGRWCTWWAKVSVSFPANDNFSSATTITGSQGATNGSNVRASAEPGEPNHAGNTNIVSVWYKWTAPTNGSFIFDTTGSTFDTVLAVYTGTIVTNLTAVATNNDYAQLQTSQVFFSATPGTTYYIAVDGFGGAEGNYVLNWRRPAAPVFTVQQPDTNIVVGSSVSLKSVAVGDPAPAYQWKFNATNALSGATNSTLTLFNAQYNQAGNYTTIASNLAGTAASSAALLTVQSTYASTNSLWAYSSNQFGFHVAGLTGHWYSVQFTSNLSTNHVWVNSMSNIVSFDFTDTNASNYSQRFYRSVYAP